MSVVRAFFLGGLGRGLGGRRPSGVRLAVRDALLWLLLFAGEFGLRHVFLLRWEFDPSAGDFAHDLILCALIAA